MILWITGKNGVSQSMQSSLVSLLNYSGLQISDVYFHTLATGEVEEAVKEFDTMIDKYEPKAVVCQDARLVSEFVGVGLPRSAAEIRGLINNARGSVYTYKGLKVVILATFDVFYKLPYARFLFHSDLAKLSRWYKDAPRPEPQFSYSIIDNIDKLAPLETLLKKATLIAVDIETISTTLSCIGFGAWIGGGVYNFVIPLVDPSNDRKDNSYWENAADRVKVWECIKNVLDNEVPKAFQNGNFDNAYLLRHNIVVRNYLLDPYHMWHCISQNTPKSLHFISSICLDNYKFWKEEAKGDDAQELDKKKHDIGNNTHEEMKQYWRYNALDCYNTVLSCRHLLAMMERLGYPLENYRVEFNLVRGPALFSTMHGFDIDPFEQNKIISGLEKTAAVELAKIKEMTTYEDFNPNSTKDMQWLVYQILGASRGYNDRKTDRKTSSLSVDKSILSRVAEEHPLYAIIFNTIFKYKEARNNISKYSKCHEPYTRLYWRANASGTKTWRWATSRHHFRTGTNAQNIPEKIRSMFVVSDIDEWYLFDFDFSQSDFYYIAHESEDPAMIETAVSSKDTHIINAGAFFGSDYDELYNAYKSGDKKAYDTRYLAKRLTHACNGMLGGYTMYMHSGKEVMEKAAELAGEEGHKNWGVKQFEAFGNKLIKLYFTKYYIARQWMNNMHKEVSDNNNLSKIGGGMTRRHFGEIRKNSHDHRDFVMWHGQGGTSWAINRVLNEWFYGAGEHSIDKTKCQIFLQVHDSVIGKVRKDGLGELEKLAAIMEAPVVIKDRQFYVPAEGQIGYIWDKGGMTAWKPGITPKEIDNKVTKPQIAENLEI